MDALGLMLGTIAFWAFWWPKFFGKWLGEIVVAYKCALRSRGFR